VTHTPPTLTVGDSFPDDVRAAIVGNDPDPFLLGGLKLTWLPKTWHVTLHANGEPVAHAGLVEVTVEAGGEALRVAGLGGVITRADRRGQGDATAALAHFGEETRARGIDFGMLFCRAELVPYYARRGWTELTVPVMVEQPDGPIPMPTRAMVKSFGARTWPPGDVRVPGHPW